ncbi:eukaryotic membrane protein family-domain-containing protein [Dunaliella salina]|uniref:Eukaryotic membrane protein family-domain-containing protein n=1 Tax=Dunaliella salina TaxID=3046 RepID=A0ABQ7H6F6_DUNSA|nr:eukaryotic membrane protein family-domain-containing protein [Dunaliella salina]|eukprot:KAF5842436.1 eukaryotic membrane protein family-domain-containing protein [Dunaliella salina]
MSHPCAHEQHNIHQEPGSDSTPIDMRAPFTCDPLLATASAPTSMQKSLVELERSSSANSDLYKQGKAWHKLMGTSLGSVDQGLHNLSSLEHEPQHSLLLNANSCTPQPPPPDFGSAEVATMNTSPTPSTPHGPLSHGGHEQAVPCSEGFTSPLPPLHPSTQSAPTACVPAISITEQQQQQQQQQHQKQQYQVPLAGTETHNFSSSKCAARLRSSSSTGGALKLRYNFLMYVPYQLERLIQFGTLLCLDSFLGIMTIMPYRAAVALLTVGRGILARWSGSRGSAAVCAEAVAPGSNSRRSKIGGSQLYDIVCMLILLGSSAILRAIRPGFIYYWLKDITSEFLKMSVLSSAFEIADKSSSCTRCMLLHAVILMCQGLVLAVALNSKRNGLLALLIANNFVEIKGAVFKRWDVPRIWGLVCMDIVERLHLFAILIFVVIEDMESSSTWSPSSNILRESIKILGSEVIIDILKHAMLGKFNDVRPGLYREYMKDLCDKAVSAQSHTLHKLMGFHHLAPGCLVLRTLTTLFWINLETWDISEVSLRVCAAFAIWLGLALVKPCVGWGLKIVAHRYVVYYTKRYNTKASHASRVPSALGTNLLSGRPSVHQQQQQHHHHHHHQVAEHAKEE